MINLNRKWRKSLRSNTLWPLKQVSLDGDWRRLKIFIILMMDISHTLQASMTLTILHLTLIANLKWWKSFSTSRASLYEADLKVEEACNEHGHGTSQNGPIYKVEIPIKVSVIAFIRITHTYTSPLHIH